MNGGFVVNLDNSEFIHPSNILCLLFLTLIVGCITYCCFRVHSDIGPIWDTYDLLANAAFYAGNDIGYYDPLRPPLMSILGSLYLEKTLITWPIMFIDGLIFVFGSIGLYLLFKLRFDVFSSLLGTLLFVTYPVVLTFATEGLTDIPSVCIAIWGLLFTVLAVKKNTRMFYIAFPLLTLAFFTRYSTALFIFPVLLYILINRDTFKPWKDMFIGIGISIMIPIFILHLYQVELGSTFISLANFFKTSSISSETASSMILSYNPDILYYVKLMLFATWFEGMALILVTILGLILFLIRGFRLNKQKNGPKQFLKDKWACSVLIKKKLFLTMLILIIFGLTFDRIHYLASEILFFSFLFLSYNLLQKYKIRDMDFDFLFLSWLMAFFIFHSAYIIKDFRYVIVMIPPLTYFLIRGFKLATSQFNLKIRDKNLTHILFSSILITLTITSALAYMPVISATNVHLKEMNENSAVICSWLEHHDPDYKNKVIYSDYWPYTAWHLRMDVGKMPIFRCNQTIYTGAKDYNFTEQDIQDYNQVLDNNHADYYFTRVGALNLTNYRLVKKVGDFILYERVK